MPKSTLKNPIKQKSKSKQSDRLSFDSDLAVRILAKKDPVLAKLMKKAGPFALDLEPISSPFHALAESVVYQQLNARAAVTIFGRVSTLFGSPEFLCPYAVSEISDDLLHSAGLSRSKLAAIKDLAAKTIDGLVPSALDLEKMDDDEIINRLTTIRGIGRWTVEMMLIFRLGRPDVLPINDYAVRKGFAISYNWSDLPKPNELEEYGERWRPYRTVAAWYLWRSLD